MENDESERARVRLVRALLRKVADDTYPSTTIMDTLEELIRPDEIDDYAEILIRHIENDRFPSPPMIYRLRNLTAP